MHRSRLGVVLIDVDEPDHDKALAFWAAALGAKATQGRKHPEYHELSGPGLPLEFLFQRIGGPSRVHLDFQTDDVEAEVARLEAAGAEKVELIDEWQVMRDPAGLLFCVVPVPADALTADNSVTWP
jgi:catechol 2,3-dioxygenase-like lactoylglutathione lyase family enzyme